MKWSIQQLHKYLGRPFSFDATYDFSKQIIPFDDMIAISPIRVVGEGVNLYDDRFQFKLHIIGELTLEDSRTLEPVAYPINLEVTEIFDTKLYDDDSRLIEKNTNDLQPIEL
jgi:uncharacterized protein